MSRQSASSPTRRIIVTYRRGDAEAQARRLIRTLRRHFGDDSVKSCYDFHASEPLSPGGAELTVMVFVIGRRWFKLLDDARPGPADRRAHEAEALAFSPAVDTIYVFVGGAPVPAGVDLSLTLRLRDARWEQDVEKLIFMLGWLGAAGEPASDDTVKLYLRREDAVKLVTALTVYLGSAPEAPRGVKKGGGKHLTEEGPTRASGGAAQSKAAVFDQPGWRVKGETKFAYQKDNPADVVSCTVFSPPSVTPGAAFLVQVFAHLPDDVGEAAQLAKEAVREAEKLGSKTLDSEVERESKLRFDLSLPSLAVDEPSQDLIWRGRPEAVQFGVAVAPTHTPGNVIGTVRVSQDGVPFGHVKFQLTVAAREAAAPAPQPQPTRDWVRYQKAFISYASKDRAEVLKRAQMLARMVPDFFLDLMKLEPGDRWRKGLYKQIDDSDAFFLFWSTAAKQSRWVMKEVDYALARKGGDDSAPPEIIPMIIEGPPPVKPPRRLSHLHFNDLFLYLMEQPAKKAKQKGRPRKRRQP